MSGERVNDAGRVQWRRFCEDAIWDVLTPEQHRRLAAGCGSRQYARGAYIFHQDDPPEGLYCIRSGYVLLSQVDRFGNETAFRLATGGEVIGYRSLFAEQPHSAGARSLAPTRACCIPRTLLRGLRDENHALDAAFLKTLARDPGFVDAPLLRSPLLPLRVRFAYLLTVLRREHGRPVEEGLLFEVPLTQRDTAALLGARPETVARVHRELEDAGLCRFRRGRILVCDSDAVEALAAGDTEAVRYGD